MALRLEELAKTIDHALLHPTATAADVERSCEEALAYHFASVCVFPTHVLLAVERLRGFDVKVCAVVSFPFGADLTKTKIAAAEQCVSTGADELDVVINVSAMLSGDFRLVRDELASLVRAVRVRSVNTGKGLVLVKPILESHLLDDKLKKLACKIVEDAGADFAVTSTGYGSGGATLYDVELLRDYLPESVGVKASGGITTVEDAYAMVNAGAGRIGTADAVGIMRGFPGLRQVS